MKLPKKNRPSPSPLPVAIVALAVGLVGAALVLAVVLDRAWVVELVAVLCGRR